MNYGYTRVSTKDQILEMQIDALNNSNSHKVFYTVKKGQKLINMNS